MSSSDDRANQANLPGLHSNEPQLVTENFLVGEPQESEAFIALLLEAQLLDSIDILSKSRPTHRMPISDSEFSRVAALWDQYNRQVRSFVP